MLITNTEAVVQNAGLPLLDQLRERGVVDPADAHAELVEVLVLPMEEPGVREADDRYHDPERVIVGDPARGPDQVGQHRFAAAPQVTDDVATLASRMEEHLKKMGAVWK